jgi:AraC-like DNA-binding protein
MKFDRVRLVETRQEASPPSLPRGMLDRGASAKRIRVSRYPTSEALQPFADCHWIIEWSVAENEPQQQRVLSSPNANIVVTEGDTGLFGVARGVEARALRGSGCAVGLRFRVGGIRPFLAGPVAHLTGRKVSPLCVTHQTEAAMEASILSQTRHEDMIRAMEAMILPRIPAPDPTVDLISSMIHSVREEDGPMRAEALAAKFDLSLRSLQRLFHDYVGASPKWVIRRCRLQDAAYLLGEGDNLKIAAIASDLGYFDQAHMASDFRRMFGCSPAQYRSASS